MGDIYPAAAGQNLFCEIVRKYSHAVFTLINNAFGRNYTEGDILEMQPGRVLYVKSDKIRRYDFFIADGIDGSRMACLTESEGEFGFWGNKPVCSKNMIWIEVCNIAVIRPMGDVPENGTVKCVIDSPGGALDYAVSVVTVDESEPEFAGLLRSMFGK